jgi:hypothetical protein
MDRDPTSNKFLALTIGAIGVLLVVFIVLAHDAFVDIPKPREALSGNTLPDPGPSRRLTRE